MNWSPIRATALLAIAIAPFGLASIAVGQDTSDPGDTATRDERAFAHSAHRLLHRADSDRDGVVTQAEWQALSDEIAGSFASLDTDGDGAVTLERSGRRERVGREGARPRQRGAGGREGIRHHRTRIAGAMMFRAADQAGNADGSLDRNEWTNFLAEADSDRDGALQTEEVRQSLQALRDDSHTPPAPTIDVLTDRFDELDADGNGVISGEELPPARRSRRFAG